MSNVRRMPGDSCRYYAAGRCLYAERLNPGYDESLRCRHLALWEREFDAFLDRAEAFGLGQEELAAFWERRFERLRSEGRDCCPNYRFRSDGGEQGCDNGWDDLCLLALPRCAGRCRHYLPHEPEASAVDDNHKER